MSRNAAYEGLVHQLAAALTATGATFTQLSAADDDIGGVAHYDVGNDRLIYDVLVIPDEQGIEAGRYLFRFVNGSPDFKPSYELRTDDLDAVIAAMRAHALLAA